MPPRTRTSTGTLKRKSTQLDIDSDLDAELDSDFLALSRRQRREVDKAYDRALRAVEGSRGRKRRKVAMEKVDSAGGGGGGGFVVEEDVEMSDSGGGFVPDEEEDEGRMETSIGGGGGGFVADEQDISPAPSPSLRSLLPLTSLPSAINSLGLEWDEDVLAVFQSQSTDQSDGATKRDFRAVCAAMMEVEADDGEDEQGDEMNMSDDSEDEYQGVEQENAGSESPLSPLSDGYEKDSTITDRRRRRPPPASDPSMRADVPTVKLSRDQKDFISRMWETMFEGSERERGQRLLGRDQVKRWAGIMGEMWGDEELTEMIQLFSTQPGKRGLSYEDFTNLLVRGGLV